MRSITTIVIAALSGIVFAGSPATAREPLRYVALGDSSVAGPGIPNEIDATCLRSDRDWPHVLAGRLGAAPASPAYAYHPNAQGMAAVATIMDNAVRKARGTW
jgi:hypothetical protein